MIRLINKITGGDMWVADGRLDEYLAAGHKPAAVLPPPEPTEEKPVKRRRTTKKG